LIQFDTAFGLLARGGVEFIVVGGAAATIHGSARITRDLDIVYRRTAQNIQRLAAALAPCAPYLRGAPAGLPFRWHEETLRRGLNFTLTTSVETSISSARSLAAAASTRCSRTPFWSGPSTRTFDA
jgi:hypothetical protein